MNQRARAKNYLLYCFAVTTSIAFAFHYFRFVIGRISYQATTLLLWGISLAMILLVSTYSFVSFALNSLAERLFFSIYTLLDMLRLDYKTMKMLRYYVVLVSLCLRVFFFINYTKFTCLLIIHSKTSFLVCRRQNILYSQRKT